MVQQYVYIMTFMNIDTHRISILYYLAASGGELTRREIKIIDELLPLKFDLKKIISKNDFENLENNAFDVLRQRYLKAFFENSLMEDNWEIIKRFNKIVNMVHNNSITLAISHAYLIKELEAYFKLDEEMFSDFGKLSEIFKPEKETMGRLETVEVIIN